MNRDKITMNGTNAKKICKTKGFGRSEEIGGTNVCDIQTYVVPNDNLTRSFIFKMHRHVLEFRCDIMRCPRVKHPTIGGRLRHDSAVSLCQHTTKPVTFCHSVAIEATKMASFS